MECRSGKVDGHILFIFCGQTLSSYLQIRVCPEDSSQGSQRYQRSVIERMGEELRILVCKLNCHIKE